VFFFAADGLPVDILKSLQSVSISMSYCYVLCTAADASITTTDNAGISFVFYFIYIIPVTHPVCLYIACYHSYHLSVLTKYWYYYLHLITILPHEHALYMLWYSNAS